jgi:hypothetical protein
MLWDMKAQQVAAMTFFTAFAPVLAISALPREGRARFPWPLRKWVRAIASEARRAAEAEHRYRQLRYLDPVALAPEGGAPADVQRRIFAEFYA